MDFLWFMRPRKASFEQASADRAAGWRRPWKIMIKESAATLVCSVSLIAVFIELLNVGPATPNAN